MEIVTGTYEELLLGYTLVEEEGGYSLQQTFTDHSHTGCIKCVAISDNKILVSGSTDEIIHIFNLRTRKDYGTLMQHTGSLTWLEFFQNSHLFSTGEDGKLCVWKVAGWESLRTFKGHKGAVNCVSIHPSGKMALTVGQDHTLKTWNLVTGRSAFTSNIKHVADHVVWSPSGDCYAVTSNNIISIYKVEDCKVYHKIQATGRICALTFLTAEILAYSGDGGIIYFHDVNGTELHQITTDTNRVRGLAISPPHTQPDSGNLWLTSASSDGHIKVYSIQVKEDTVISQLLVSHDTKFRLTCVATSRPPRNQSDKSAEEMPKAAVKTKKPRLKTSGREHVSEENQTLDIALSEQKPKRNANSDKSMKKKRKVISEQESCSKKAKKEIDHKSSRKNRIKKKKYKARSEKNN